MAEFFCNKCKTAGRIGFFASLRNSQPCPSCGAKLHRSGADAFFLFLFVASAVSEFFSLDGLLRTTSLFSAVFGVTGGIIVVRFLKYRN